MAVQKHPVDAQVVDRWHGPGIDRHRFGVNLTPTQQWWYCWNQWDADAIARDLDAVVAIGADHVRVFLIWPFFQPNRTCVSDEHLDRMEKLLELCDQRGLDVCVAALNGWLTGFAFRPAWEVPRAGHAPKAGFYESERAIEGTEIFLRAVAKRLDKHDNVLGVDLGNEIGCCWRCPTPGVADRWADRLLSLLEDELPGRLHVVGADHMPFFYSETFSPHFLAARSAMVCMHTWIRWTGAMILDDPLGPGCTGFPAAMAALGRAYAGQADKPVWIQEYGSSDAWMDREQIPAFLEQATLEALQGGVAWMTWWCSHDLDRRFEVGEQEYSMGLIDVTNRTKPTGEVFHRLADAHRGTAVQIPAQQEMTPPALCQPEETWAWFREHCLPRLRTS